MSKKFIFAAIVLAAVPVGQCFGQQGSLIMGMDSVGWENGNATAPFLFKEIDASELVEVRARLTSQALGNWSLAGVMVRQPGTLGDTENWMTSWSFNVTADFAGTPPVHQSNMVTDSGEAEMNDDGPASLDDLRYLRLVNMGSGEFLAYRGADDGMGGITWTEHAGGSQMNANLATGTLEVGVAAGAIGNPNGGGNTTVWDWVEIETQTMGTFSDSFEYERDFAVDGVAPGAGQTGLEIWDGIWNPGAGGQNTIATNVTPGCDDPGCFWNNDGSGNWATDSNWLNASLTGNPDANDHIAVFDDTALTTGPATVYTNGTVTAKEMRFDHGTAQYVLAGAGQINMESDTGTAEINVVSGSHQIQVDLNLVSNTNATADAFATLNVNAPVFLNGNTLTIAGGGTVNLNNGVVLPGTVAGAAGGAVVNEGNLVALAGVGGDLSQTDSGSLAVVVGGSPIEVSGDAVLDGVLDVSVADGFKPVNGETYTVLTAASVTDLGLALGGDASGAFRLAVGAGSVGVTAVPEPASIALLSFGLVALGLARRRRRGNDDFFFGNANVMSRLFTCGVVFSFIFSLAASSALAQLPHGALDFTRTDTFGESNPGTVDYRTTDPAGTFNSTDTDGPTIWAGRHNELNGGDPLFGLPANFQRDGESSDGAGGAMDGVGAPVSTAGRLIIEDRGEFANPGGAFGIGWEGDTGDKNNAPFLFTTVSSDSDFDAYTKISAMSAGNWNMASIVTRVAGPPTGICCGEDAANSFDEALTPAESFVNAGAFRTDDMNPQNATLSIENVVDGGNGGGGGGGLAPPGPTGAEPVWLRVEKRGGVFQVSSSADDVATPDLVTTWDIADTVLNEGIGASGNTLEVGLSFMRFPGPEAAAMGARIPRAEYDYFRLEVFDPPATDFAIWGGGSGNWNTDGNWLANAGAAPNANNVDVTFNQGGAGTTYTNTNVMAKSITLNSTNTRAIGGAGTLMMSSTTGTSNVDVNAGSHRIQAVLTLGNNTTITAADGAQLDIYNTLNLGGNTLTIAGDGRVNVNNANGTAGSVEVSGNLGGTGTVHGPVNVQSGGTVTPGLSPGTLTVDGNYTQAAGGTLNVELGGLGAGLFGLLDVTGTANLNGRVDADLFGGFVPAVSDTFDIVTASSVIDAGIALTGHDEQYYDLSVVGANTLRLTVTAVPSIPGDYNGDGKVGPGDYTVYRNTLGSTTDLRADGNENDVIDVGDYEEWKLHYGAMALGAGSALGATVPEPSSFALLLMAALGFCGFLRRR